MNSYHSLRFVSKDGRYFSITTGAEADLRALLDGATLHIIKRTYETVEHGEEEVLSIPISSLETQS